MNKFKYNAWIIRSRQTKRTFYLLQVCGCGLCETTQTAKPRLQFQNLMCIRQMEFRQSKHLKQLLVENRPRTAIKFVPTEHYLNLIIFGILIFLSWSLFSTAFYCLKRLFYTWLRSRELPEFS